MISIKKIFLSSQGFPIFLTMTILAILFVFFRMRGVEIDYQSAEIKKEKKEMYSLQKQLKGQKAKLLSIKNLKNFAKKHALEKPKSNKIIVIP